MPTIWGDGGIKQEDEIDAQEVALWLPLIKATDIYTQPAQDLTRKAKLIPTL